MKHWAWTLIDACRSPASLCPQSIVLTVGLDPRKHSTTAAAVTGLQTEPRQWIHQEANAITLGVVTWQKSIWHKALSHWVSSMTKFFLSIRKNGLLDYHSNYYFFDLLLACYILKEGEAIMHCTPPANSQAIVCLYWLICRAQIAAALLRSHQAQQGAPVSQPCLTLTVHRCNCKVWPSQKIKTSFVIPS